MVYVEEGIEENFCLTHHREMHRRPYLLLELLVSLAIFAFILQILFQSYKEYSIVKKEIKDIQDIVLPRQVAQLRLSQIFSGLKSMEAQEGNKYFFTYDNGPDLEEDFRGEVDAMLYLEKNHLAFALYSKKGEKSRKELIFGPINEFSLEFFDEKKEDFDGKCPEKKPFMIKAHLDKLVFPFFI